MEEREYQELFEKLVSSGDLERFQRWIQGQSISNQADKNHGPDQDTEKNNS